MEGSVFPINDRTGIRKDVDTKWVEAMLIAVDRINNDMNLLPDLTIGFDTRDICNEESYGFYNALDSCDLAIKYEYFFEYGSQNDLIGYLRPTLRCFPKSTWKPNIQLHFYARKD